MRMKGMKAAHQAIYGGSTNLKDLLAQCHKAFKKSGLSDQLDRYFEAVQLGFAGHMKQWADSITSGVLFEGPADRTPEKVKRRLQ